MRSARQVLARLWKARPVAFTDLLRGRSLSPQFDPQAHPGVASRPASTSCRRRSRSCSIPLKVIACDFYAWTECVLSEGPLKPAIAASIAIPAIFRPVNIDGRILIDGGASNPLPFEHVSDCDITVACDVTGGPTNGNGRGAPGLLECVVGAAQISMQSVIREKLRWHQPDMLVRPEINGIFVLDFLRTQSILDMNDGFKDDLKRRLDLVINTPFEEPSFSPPVEEEAAKKRRRRRLADSGVNLWRMVAGGRAKEAHAVLDRRRPWGRRLRNRAAGCARRKWPPRIRCRARASRRDRIPSAAPSRAAPAAARIASTSACAVTSPSSRVRLPAAATTSPVADDDGADRHLAARAGRPRLLQRQLHEARLAQAHLASLSLALLREPMSGGAAKEKQAAAGPDAKGERIAKVIARAGFCSRRDAERLIGEGRVMLNGKTLTTPGDHRRPGGPHRGRRRGAEGARAHPPLALPQAEGARHHQSRPGRPPDRLLRAAAGHAARADRRPPRPQYRGPAPPHQ